MEKAVSVYSPYCKDKKYNPKSTVKPKLWVAEEYLPSSILWWAQVTVTPDNKSTAVFNKGTWKASRVKTPVGGQIAPTSMVGDNLLWK